MKSRSLVGSLSRSLSVALILAVLVQDLLVTRTFAAFTQDYASSRLMHDAESLLAAIRIEGRELSGLATERIQPAFSQPYSGHYFRLRLRELRPGGKSMDLSSGSSRNHSLQLAPLKAGMHSLSRQQGPREQALLVLQRTVTRKAVLIELAVAEDLTPLDQALQRFNLAYILGSWLVLLCLLTLQRWVLQRRLAALVITRGELARIENEGNGRLGEQIPSEILPLVQGFNRLQAKQQQRLQHARQRFRELSSALLHPLGRVQQELKTRPWPVVEADIAEIHTRIRRELTRSRLDDGTPVLLPLSPLVQELLASLNKLYAAKELHVSLELPPRLKLRMDRQDALELLGNLLDKAFKWADRSIELQAGSAAGIWLRISCDGPGARTLLPDQPLPGQEPEFALARELVQSYGGSLKLGPSRLGGLEILLRLPEAI